MKRIKILTDSVCDITYELEKELDVRVLPIPINIDGESYLERVDFTPFEFYEKLINAKTSVTTSQLPPTVYFDEFKRIYEEGYDHVIYISINSLGSGCYQSAVSARKMFISEYPELSNMFDIHVIDSKSYSLGYGLAVSNAAKMVKEKDSIENILSYLTEYFNKVEVYFVPYTLEFAKKSGRINVFSAFVGELMGIRPIIRIKDGKMDIVQKIRGNINIIPTLLEIAKDRMIEGSDYSIVNSQQIQEVNEFKHQLEKTFNYPPKYIFDVGASVTINSGPKVIAISFMSKE